MNRVPCPALAVLFLVLLLLTSGCVSISGQNANLSGRYDENIVEYEGRLAQGEKLIVQDRYLLCDAYSNTRSYSRLFTCADVFDAQVDGGSGLLNAALAGDGIPMSAAASTIWRAQAYLETGRAREALDAINARLERMDRPSVLGGLSTTVYFKLLTLRGLAQTELKDGEGARRTLAELKDTSCGFVNMVPCEGERNLGLTLVNVSLGQYRAAAETADAGGMRALWGISAAVSLGTVTYDKYLLPREFLRVKVLYETGGTAEAKAGYLALLANPATRSSGSIWWTVHYDLGRIARAEGDGALAAKHLAEAVAAIESQRANINTEAAKIGFIGDKQAVYRELVSLLVAQGRAAEAFEYVERAKSRALVDLLAGRQDLSGAGQADAEASLKQLSSLEQRSLVLSGTAEEGSRLRSAISGAQDELRRKAPELASLVTVSADRAADIQAGLAADETLLEYYGQGDELYAFTVTREGVAATRLDGRGLEADVRAFRAAVGQTSGEAWRQPGRRLYDRLLAPVPGVLDRPRLVIVSHGPLHYLPFAALHDGSRFLAERATLTFLPSAGVRRFLAARQPAAARSLLLLGNPDLGDKAFDLPGADAEARAIRGIWPDSTVLLRKAATKSALTRAGGLFRVIHVAAHGEFVAEQPLASRLLLAPEGADDGRLTAGDLYALRLPADLVTLSACETGLGQVLSGDDVIGLTRGFLYAGAGSVVASLWPVSDAETQFLMTGFYRSLKTQPKADALRQAQLETLRRYPHPFYWSAFQLTGMGR